MISCYEKCDTHNNGPTACTFEGRHHTAQQNPFLFFSLSPPGHNWPQASLFICSGKMIYCQSTHYTFYFLVHRTKIRTRHFEESSIARTASAFMTVVAVPLLALVRSALGAKLTAHTHFLIPFEQERWRMLAADG